MIRRMSDNRSRAAATPPLSHMAQWLGELLLLLVLTAMARADDWPAYRHDKARSAVTGDSLQLPLMPCWTYRPLHAPEPAWGEPNPRPVGGWYGLTEGRRVHFDDSFHVVVAGGTVYWGSSADGRVVAFDLATGAQRWCVLTGGPVRLAPTVWEDHLYVGSDDGFVYCLRCNDGVERWRFQAAPSDRKVLGSGKMISLWPVRTGVLVDGGVAYFGAGIFPAEGVYMYAVDARTGQLVWCNDNGGAAPQSRISPQGYLLASQDRLFVPLGRVSPAAYDRKDGRLLYESYIEHIIGGANATLADDQLYTGTEQMIGYDQASHRDTSSWFWTQQLVVTPDCFYAASGEEMFAVRREAYGAASLRRKQLLDRQRDVTSQLQSAKSSSSPQLPEIQQQLDTVNSQIKEAEAEMAAGQLWRVPSPCKESLVVAGDLLLAGGPGKVEARDIQSGQLLWSAEIEGRARGLAVADGRLLVSSDTGDIYSYGPPSSPHPGLVCQAVPRDAQVDDAMSGVYAEAAHHIARATGIDRGYCLMLGCETGRLAAELAERTQLRIYAVESDLEKVLAARQMLADAGLYGARVMVEHADLSDIPYSDYFANLVVSERVLLTGQLPPSVAEAVRLLKPTGGQICLGQPAVARGKVPAVTDVALQSWWAAGGMAGGDVSPEDGIWLRYARGPLAGAGSWTHQYAEPGNSTCSDDQLLRCPLGVLWFGNPGPEQMAERHRRAAAPLAINGRMFVLGEGTANRIGAGANTVMAFDAYNGVKLWEREIRGALRVSVTHDAGNTAANEESLFVAVGEQCWQLAAATGDTQRAYQLPPRSDGAPHSWGWVAVVGDVLYGSRTTKGRTADLLCAFDLGSGAILWQHELEGIAQGSLAISNGRLHFAASQVTAAQREAALAPQVQEVHRLPEAEQAALLKKLEEATVYNVVTLDARTGEKLWEQPVEVTGAVGGAYWCSLGAICKEDVLLLFGVFLDGHYWTQFLSGQFAARQVVALSASDGETLWRKPVGYRVRPLVVGDTLHAEPWAYDLRTGAQRTRVHPITGREEPWQFARPGHHCGAPAASPHMLLFRSLTLGWYDLENDFGTQHFGGNRPGCWINFIPANGLLLMPEASSGCMCPFPNSCTVVFQNRDTTQQWAYFSQPGAMTPVKHLALNLGAPGDRKDAQGVLWLGYPRPGGSLVLQHQTGLSFFPGYRYFIHDPARLDIDGTDKPWVLRSGVLGLRECRIPVAEPGDGRARYTVRLAMAELDHEAAEQRVFDIKVQGKILAEGCDVWRQAGGKCRAVNMEFKGIEADEEVTVEFVPRHANPTADQLPILQGLEVEREEMLTLGVSVPAVLLSNAEPRATPEVVIANHKEADFVGTLQVDVPQGFLVTNASTPLRVPAGQRLTIPVEMAVSAGAAAGKQVWVTTLRREDGTIEACHEALLEHLGARRRVVITVGEDAHVRHESPGTNYGASKSLAVDGGDRQMGDAHHSIAYLKFQLRSGDRPVAARLRLYNSDNPSGDSGRIRIVTASWSELQITYDTRPQLGDAIGTIGPVAENEVIEIPLDIASLQAAQELLLAVDPTGCDGLNYISREGGKPAELIVEYAD